MTRSLIPFTREKQTDMKKCIKNTKTVKMHMKVSIKLLASNYNAENNILQS
jgi:hypothetical protein